MPDDQGTASPPCGIPTDQEQTKPQWQTSVAVGMYEKRIRDARRAIQTGIHWKAGFTRDTEATLAVQIATLTATHRALAELLIDKGLISRVEYLRSVAAELDAEVAQLQDVVSRWQGREVDLHDPR